MAQITLTKKQIDKFAHFMREHNVANWFFAKDDGAYIGATAGAHNEGNFDRCIFYFKGCDPSKDKFAWENARDKFGADDFGEFFDAETIYELSDDPNALGMIFVVTDTEMEIKRVRAYA